MTHYLAQLLTKCPEPYAQHFMVWQGHSQPLSVMQSQPDHMQLLTVYCTQTYYVLVVQLFVAHALIHRDTPALSHLPRLPAQIADLTDYLNHSCFVDLGYEDALTVTGYDWYQHALTSALDDEPPAILIQQKLLSALEDLYQSFQHIPHFIQIPINETDALKNFYQDLFSKQWRHALGEHFTPDWLAEHTLNTLGYDGTESILDPACGTGTFVLQAYLRAKHTYMDQNLTISTGQLPVQALLDNIAGMDINALAIFSTRANFMLHIGKQTHPLRLPIWHVDSIQQKSDKQYDIVVGNPPWVNWEYLPDDYRDATRHLWKQYGLFPHQGLDAILGKGKKDLSLLMFLVSADKYLCAGGRLGMIMPHVALKSSGASAGLRRWQIDQTHLGLFHIDDMSTLRPFQGVAARVVILYVEKSRKTQYPVTCHYWMPKTRLNTDISLASMLKKTHRLDYEASPIDARDSTSPLFIGRGEALGAVQKIIGKSDYQAHSGVYTGGANGVYWMQILKEDEHLALIENMPERGKQPIDKQQTWVEKALLYPILHGHDLKKWQAQPSAFILMVQDANKRRGYDENHLQENFPLAWRYLQQFEPVLRKRAAYKRYFEKTTPFYSMFDIGTYSFTPYKVAWHGIGVHRMTAAVIHQHHQKPTMTNQATMPFIGVSDEQEAHYLTGCLNSSPFEYAIISHTQAGGKSFAPPGIIEHMKLITFDHHDPLHQEISQLAQAARDARAKATDWHDQGALDDAVAQLWGITPRELVTIQKNLAEIQ